MKSEALLLFNQNYMYEGDCEGLEKCIKSFDKGYKKANKTISYFPWAIVERIFRQQGGKIEVVDWAFKVPFEDETPNLETGEMRVTTTNALFIHLKGTWMGDELEEFYPIFDNQTARVISAPNAQQLNTSKQRGMVRLIARLSGIGLSIFEQQDQDFENDTSEPTHIVPTKKEETPAVPTAKKTTHKKVEKEEVDFFGNLDDNEETTPVVKETPKQEENAMSIFFGDVVENKKPNDIYKSTKKEEKVEAPVFLEPEEFDSESEEWADMLLRVKSHVKNHRELIMKYKDRFNKPTLKDLSYSELKEIVDAIEK